ncbi:hypothetical protein TRIP_C20660 [Candidatus Zixiibacteriota bacterium]|nr:hypothetical protein TRIP_C20660 [candidate division Zixibacteria bacterium]
MKTRKKMLEGHLNRKELIEVGRKPEKERPRHLSECDDCRMALEFLIRFPVAGQLPLADAPSGWINKAVAIAEQKRTADIITGVLAKLIFDSWTMSEPVGVRGQGAIEHRRLRYEAAGIIFDMRAEQGPGEWHMVARAEGAIKAAPVLLIGKNSHFANADGLYQWSAKRPPRNIRLKSDEGIIKFPELSWKKTRKK